MGKEKKEWPQSQQQPHQESQGGRGGGGRGRGGGGGRGYGGRGRGGYGGQQVAGDGRTDQETSQSVRGRGRAIGLQQPRPAESSGSPVPPVSSWESRPGISVGVRPPSVAPFSSASVVRPLSPAVQPTAASKPAETKAPEAQISDKPKKGKKKGRKDEKPSEGPGISKETPPKPSDKKEEDIVTATKKMGISPGWAIPQRRNLKKDKTIQHSRAFVERQMSIEVNYLRLDFSKSDLQIYHYDCKFVPDKPKALLRAAMRKFRLTHFPKRAPAFDGQKNLYFGGRQLENRTPLRDTVTIFDEERQKNVDFDITIELVRDNLRLKSLMDYTANGKTENLPQDVIQAADIALRYGPVDSLVLCGRSFFQKPRGQIVDLTGGFDLWHGYYQSAVLGWKPYLNVDVANKAFPKEQDVIDYIRNEYGVSENDLRGGFTDQHRRVTSGLHQYLKGLKLEYRMPSNDSGGFSKRVYKCNGIDIRQTALSHKFQLQEQGPSMSVAEYFQREKKRPLQYPKLPLLSVGNKGTMLPMEHCRVIDRQIVMRKLNERQTSNMVRNAATPTFIRKNRIMDSIQKAGFTNPCLEEFGIHVNQTFEKVTAHVLRSPQIEYFGGTYVSPRNGVWNGSKFIRSPGITKWVVINTFDRCSRDIRTVVQTLIRSGQELGITITNPIEERHCGDRDAERVLKEMALKHKPQLCLIILSPYNRDLYGIMKRVAELELGVLTQCIKADTVQKRFNPMTAKNILLKVNAKIHGKNHRLPDDPLKPNILRSKVMIVGADVTHPAPGSNDMPSIAAVAASHDADGFQYNMLYHLQGAKKEMIENLPNMIEKQLKLFSEKEHCLPDKILYYRDGVSEGQFPQVLNVELTSIRQACSRFGPKYQPGITFLVVQKRHHTRFFPGKAESDNTKNQNVLAGTLVDSQITHPTELDFYLVSHQSIQGTARPTKYHLLWDDNNFEEEELERLTYYLCYMFTRCNRSVSYPAPTYYAHLGAFRARAWIESQRINMAKLHESQKDIHQNIINNSPMFFV